MKIDVNPLKTKRTLTFVLAMLVCSAEASAAGEPVWTLQQTLMASDSEKHDWFGGAVAIEGDTLVVGDGGKTINGGAAVGAVYVFTRSNGVWQAQAKVTASNPAPYSGFGNAVALSGSTMLVGASAIGFGYFFERNGNAWTQAGAPLADASTSPYKAFGDSVAISGDFAIFTDFFFGMVGSYAPPGAAFLYQRNNGVWGSPAPFTQPGNALLYGTAVAVLGDTAVVTAQQLNELPTSGAGFVFVRNGSTWSAQGAPLRDLTFDQEFGDSVAIAGETVMLSGQRTDAMSNPLAGAAWFVRSGQTWAKQGSSLSVPNPNAPSTYLPKVAMSGDSAAMSASAVVYLFRRTNEAWARYGAPLVGEHRDFGAALALSKHDLIIGEAFSGENRPGVALVYTDGPCAGDADCPANAYCSHTDCLARCTTDADCSSGNYCENEAACVALPTQGEGGAGEGGAGQAGAGQAGAGEGGVAGELGTAGTATSIGGSAGASNGGSSSPSNGGNASGQDAPEEAAGSGMSAAGSGMSAAEAGATGETTQTGVEDQLVSSCGCRLGTRPNRQVYGLLGLAVLGLALRRKRRDSSRPI